MERSPTESKADHHGEEKLEALRNLLEGEPEAFFILVGAMKYNEQKEIFESGAFGDVDENSLLSTGTALTTGGKDRMFAAVQMHEVFPKATIVPMSRTRDENKPTYAAVTKDELIRKNVNPEQIVFEDVSINTITEFKEAAKLCLQHGWKDIVFITSNWHLPRSQALFNHIENFAEGEEEDEVLTSFVQAIQNGEIKVQFLGTTEVLSLRDKRYQKLFEAVESDERMLQRKQVEREGLAQIEAGTYAGKQIPKKIWEDQL